MYERAGPVLLHVDLFVVCSSCRHCTSFATIHEHRVSLVDKWHEGTSPISHSRFRNYDGCNGPVLLSPHITDVPDEHDRSRPSHRVNVFCVGIMYKHPIDKPAEARSDV